MDAVIVVRREINTREMPAAITLRQTEIAAQQREQRIGVTLGLNHQVAIDDAALTDGAVYRTDECICFGRNGVCSRLERAREKSIKTRIGVRIGFDRLCHIDTKAT